MFWAEARHPVGPARSAMPREVCLPECRLQRAVPQMPAGSGVLCAPTDEIGQIWTGGLLRNAEAVTEIVAEGDGELRGGAHQARKASRQSRPATLRVPRPDLSLGHVQADVRSGPLVCRGISGRSAGRHQSLPRRTQPRPQTFPVDQEPKENPRRVAALRWSWARTVAATLSRPVSPLYEIGCDPS